MVKTRCPGLSANQQQQYVSLQRVPSSLLIWCQVYPVFTLKNKERSPGALVQLYCQKKMLLHRLSSDPQAL